MKFRFTTPLILAMSSVIASGQEPFASEDELARLQTDLANLETDLATSEPLPEDVSARVERIHEDVVYIKVKMRKEREGNGASTGVSRDEVRNLRLDIADLRNDLREHIKTPKRKSGLVSIPAGTEFPVRLEAALSSASAESGDRFTATAVGPILAGNDVALEAGSLFHGRVELVDRASGRTDRTARLVLAVNHVESAGKNHTVTATVPRKGWRRESARRRRRSESGPASARFWEPCSAARRAP